MNEAHFILQNPTQHVSKPISKITPLKITLYFTLSYPKSTDIAIIELTIITPQLYGTLLRKMDKVEQRSTSTMRLNG